MATIKFHGPHAQENGLSAVTMLTVSGKTQRAFSRVNNLRRADIIALSEIRLDELYSSGPKRKMRKFAPLYGVHPSVETEFEPTFTTRVATQKGK